MISRRGVESAPPLSEERRLLEGKIREAKRAIGFETLWPRVWPPLAVAGVFIVFSAFEGWRYLTPQMHWGLLWAFGICMAASLIPLALWKRPTTEAALDRLERVSALDHRPLTAYNDTLSAGAASPETEALWHAHRARMAALLRKLKAGAPAPRVDKYDPFAFRAALILMLVVVSAWAWTDLGARVAAAFKVPEMPLSADFRLDAWITPPSYTRKDPVVLANGALPSSAADAVQAPEGSTLTVRINGAEAQGFTLSFTPNNGAKAQLAPAKAEERYAEYTRKIESSGVFAIKRNYGSERSWPLAIIPDYAPKISFTGPLEVSSRSVMLMKYKVEDDYGVISAEARIERVNQGGEEQPMIGKPPVFALSLPRSPIKSAEAKTYKDLTSHPWAGLPVILTLVAKDEAGHEGMSAPRGFILPERKFTKLIARAVIDQRRALVQKPFDTATVADSLNAIAIAAGDEELTPSSYLGLRSAYWRLRNNHTLDDVESVVDQLWDVAIKIEDGNLPGAERDLRAAQERLKEALERGASQDEIQKLMAELRQALNRYLQELASRAAKDRDAKGMPDHARTISGQDLQKLLNKIESLAKSGSTDAANRMLSELRDILESLQTGKQARGSGEGEGEAMQQLDRLTDLARRQQQLLDQTFRAQRNEGINPNTRGLHDNRQQGGDQGHGDNQGAGDDSQALENRQGEIQKLLKGLLPEIPGGKVGDTIRQKLEEADRAMGEARQSLQDNDLPLASDQEGEALESLRQGARAMAEEMMRQAGNGGANQASRDPLGRRQGGEMLDPGDNVKVPDEITIQRAREILDELRKRLGQPSRPPVERDYIERLIKRF